MVVFKTIRAMYSFFLGFCWSLFNLKNPFSFIVDVFRTWQGKKCVLDTISFRNGLVLSMHPKSRGLSYLFFEIFCKQIYDGMKNFRITKNDVVIDIGAHIGFFSIKAAQAATNGRVLSFEPFSYHFKMLQKNVDKNKLDNIKIFNEAVSDTAGKLTLYYSLDGEPKDSSFYVVDKEQQVSSETINTISLKEVFRREKITKCNLLKIDCEGAEYQILMKSDTQTLRQIDKIAMEWHRFSPEHEPVKLAEYLEQNGFVLVGSKDFTANCGLLYACRK